MENPETISPQIMYNYQNRLNDTWNMKEYKTPQEYLDPNLQVKKREWEKQKKGQPNKKYVTKKGFYMDYDLKVSKGIPGSNAHGDNSAWSFEREAKISKHRKMDPKLIKETYIQKIQIQQKNRKVPGIGTYSLEKSLKEKQEAIKALATKKYSVGDKRFFHEDTSLISNGVPGAGNYNPHDQVRKIRLNKTNYKQWTKKHFQQSEKKRKRDSSIPAPGTYNPMNCTFATFDSISQSPKNKEKKIDYFGNDARFEYTRPDKKKIKEIRPSPNMYNTIMDWKGKKSPKNSKGWYDSVSKGFATMSVYNS